ncbi:Cytochrome P450 monooxygenase eqxH [Fusarium oxysporum f. sp. albedinis]|nr:Cytochrome P450 monooxygenase eqxH [Fusarium oxysporum f. sp. albedinis]
MMRGFLPGEKLVSFAFTETGGRTMGKGEDMDRAWITNRYYGARGACSTDLISQHNTVPDTEGQRARCLKSPLLIPARLDYPSSFLMVLIIGILPMNTLGLALSPFLDHFGPQFTAR